MVTVFAVSCRILLQQACQKQYSRRKRLQVALFAGIIFFSEVPGTAFRCGVAGRTVSFLDSIVPAGSSAVVKK